MKPIASYWVYEVCSLDGENPRALVISPNDTLAQAMAGAFKDAAYYIGVCGYKVGVTFQERCSACNGTGHTVKRLVTRPCKVCKGKPVVREVPMTPWMTDENVKISEVDHAVQP